MSVHVLYRMYSQSGTLLYVGRTAQPPQRFKAHKYTKQWWSEVSRIDIEHCANRAVLERRERKAIQDERPLYNVQEKRPEKKVTYPPGVGLHPCGECLNCDDGLGLCDDYFGEDAPSVLVEYDAKVAS